MKKLILSIAIVLTLNSCSKPDQPTTQTTQNTLVVEYQYLRKLNGDWVYWKERPLQPTHAQYNSCYWVGTVVEWAVLTDNDTYNKMEWRIACK